MTRKPRKAEAERDDSDEDVCYLNMGQDNSNQEIDESVPYVHIEFCTS